MQSKKEKTMDKIKIPEFLPEYKIEKSDEKTFDLNWQEELGWFIIPKLNEKCCWGIYDLPSRKCDYVYDMSVTGKAEVHGIEGVEVLAKEFKYSNPQNVNKRKFIAQLTDTHCRYLATSFTENGVKKILTFLDGDDFMLNWGYGEDNCGNETHISAKGIIHKDGDKLTYTEGQNLLDIVGSYKVTIGGKIFDTVCVIDIGSYNEKVLAEHYLDKNGKTILWRRFNKNDWHLDRYKKLWTDQLPENERLFVNGETYVHWYDCITDYIV